MLSNEQKAVLDMIAYAEGTAGVSKNGYDVTFNFYRIPDWTFDYKLGHQDSAWLVDESGFKSTAAGRYQILGQTWKELSYENFKLKNAPFNKNNQDLLGAALIERRNKKRRYREGTIIVPAPPSLEDLTSNNFYKLLDSLAPEWASLPFSLNDGKGFYGGQNGKYSISELFNIYQIALEKYNT